MKLLFNTTLLLFTWTLCLAQEMPDNQYFEIDAKDLKTLNLHNLRGDVDVKGTDTRKIQVTIKRQLKSRKQTQLAEARAQYHFDTLSRGNNIYFFMQSPQHDFKIDEEGNGSYNACNNWHWNERESISYYFDVTVEFPKDMNLKVSSHHDGLRISEVDGELYARSHHKDLTVSNIGGNAALRSHHGDIEASFSKNPNDACSFKTHHGDIRIVYQDQFSADVNLKSHHGEFFTDFEWEPRPMTVLKEPSSKGTKYKVGDGTLVAINGGGPQQRFSTWHGDIYLVKN